MTLHVLIAGAGVGGLALAQGLRGAGIGDDVHFGRRACDVDVDAGGVTLRFADGATARGDVLVAADGVSSFLRAHTIDTGLRVADGRTTLTPERLDWLPERFFAGFTAVVGPHSSMAAGAMRQRRPVAEAVAEFAPGARVDPFADYLMWAMVAPGSVNRPALDLAEGWHPTLRRVIAEADPESCFPMTPAAGSGANTALRDAALLTDLLGAARLDPVPALTTYAEQMRRYATDAVHLSLRNSNLEHLLP